MAHIELATAETMSPTVREKLAHLEENGMKVGEIVRLLELNEEKQLLRFAIRGSKKDNYKIVKKMINFKQIQMILVLLLSLSFSIQADEIKTDNNNSEKCAIGNCDIMKSKVIAMVEEKFNQISLNIQNQELNSTAITLKMESVLNGLSQDNNNSVCMKMFTKMMKVPLETFLEYKEEKVD